MDFKEVPFRAWIFAALVAPVVVWQADTAVFAFRLAQVIEYHGYGNLPHTAVPRPLLPAELDRWVVLLPIPATILFMREMALGHGIASVHTAYARLPVFQRWWMTLIALPIPLINLYVPWRGFNQIWIALVQCTPRSATPTLVLAVLWLGALATARMAVNAVPIIEGTDSDMAVIAASWRWFAITTAAATVLLIAYLEYSTFYLASIIRGRWAFERKVSAVL